jgi:hypothetical protein
MGTGSHEDIRYEIKGCMSFDYEDEVNRVNIFRRRLELLCAEYGLELVRTYDNNNS